MSKQLRIERGIPMPPTLGRQGHNIELLKAMAIGDSVYFDAPIVKKAVRFYRVAQKLGVKVIIRKDRTGMRMWRVENEAPEQQSEAVAKMVTAKHKAAQAVSKAVQMSRRATDAPKVKLHARARTKVPA